MLTLYGSATLSPRPPPPSHARGRSASWWRWRRGKVVSIEKDPPASESDRLDQLSRTQHAGEADLTLDETATTMKGRGDRISERCAPRQARAIIADERSRRSPSLSSFIGRAGGGRLLLAHSHLREAYQSRSGRDLPVDHSSVMGGKNLGNRV